MDDKQINIIIELQSAGYDDDDDCNSMTFSTSLPHTLPVSIARTAIYNVLGKILDNISDVDISLTRNFAAEAYCFACFCRMGFADELVNRLAVEPVQVTIPFPLPR